MSILDAVATRLRKAYSDGAIPPLRGDLEGVDVDGAYAVQAINTAFWKAEGRRVSGHKVGLTSKAVQTQLGVGQPDFGVLFDDMAISDGGTLRVDRVLQPKAEAEVAFVLVADLVDPDLTADDVIVAIGAALPAIEIVDSRIADWKITFADTVADNGSSAFYVLGSQPKPLAGLDLRTCGMVLEVNDEVVSLGAGAACLGHPLNAVAWLARTLALRGAPLRAGEVILSGALGPMVALKPGDRVTASIGGLGTVGFKYGDGA